MKNQYFYHAYAAYDSPTSATRESYNRPTTSKQRTAEGYNTGRWTVSEHNLFMECKYYG